MNKILIIGQAPPLKEQAVPYDSTMLYDWFDSVGVSKKSAADMFDFDAISNEFPGLTKNNQHKKPSKESVRRHYENCLKTKIELSAKIIILGNVAKEFLPPITDKPVLFLMHPSRRNYHKYTLVKDQLLIALKTFLNL